MTQTEDLELEDFENEPGDAAAARIVEKAERAGAAIRIETYNQRYPATKRGMKVVEKAARILPAMRWDYERLEHKEGTTVSLGRDQAFNLSALLVENRSTSAVQITLAGMKTYLRSNRKCLDDIMMLAETAPFEEIGWRRSYDRLTPFDRLVQPSQDQRRGKHHLPALAATRVLLPGAVAMALQEGDPDRAYALVIGWAYLFRSMKVAGTTVMEVLVAMAAEGYWLNTVVELRRVSPPDAETARLLLRLCDTHLAERDFVRACEIDIMVMLEVYRYFAGKTKKLPAFYRGSTTAASFQQVEKIVGGRNRIMSDLIMRAAAVHAESACLVRHLLSLRHEDDLLPRLSACQEWWDSWEDENKFLLIPDYPELVMIARGRLGKMSVVQAALILRIAELHAPAGAPLPASVDEVCLRYDLPVPGDPLALSYEPAVLMDVNAADQSYLLHMRPNLEGHHQSEGYSVQGRWRPEATSNN